MTITSLIYASTKTSKAHCKIWKVSHIRQLREQQKKLIPQIAYSTKNNNTATRNQNFSNEKLAISLYRSLLRIAKLYSFEPQGKILSSLLHRTGIEEDFHLYEYKNDNTTNKNLKNLDNKTALPDIYDRRSIDKYFEEKSNRVPLYYDEARDLSKGYVELQALHYIRSQIENDSSLDENYHSNSTDYNIPLYEITTDDYLHSTKQQHSTLLFRTLLKEILQYSYDHQINDLHSNETDEERSNDKIANIVSPYMRFPCQIKLASSSFVCNNTKSNTLWDIIKREFRANSNQTKNQNTTILPSACFSYDTRMQVAFMAMKELKNKISYASLLGFTFQDNKNLDKKNPQSLTQSLIHTHNKKRNRKQAAKGVFPLSYQDPSQYLQPGTFLIAHPLLSGYFANTVICILDHTQFIDDDPSLKTLETNQDTQTIQGKQKSQGGTYGLVINRNAIRRLRNKSTSTNTNKSTITTTFQNESSFESPSTILLKDVLRADTLPKGFFKAFGDCQVREGGPVNLSVQMMHRCSPDMEEKLQIGGRLLTPCNLEFKPISDTDQISELNTPALNTDHAIFFQGDVEKAAQAIIDEELHRTNFSFVIGASCWELGQLESEIKRGYWLPASGPVEIAFEGKCQHEMDFYDDHNDSKDKNAHHTKKEEVTPVDNLWLSMMCAMGQDEGDLAHLILKDLDDDELGEVCDNL